MRMNASVFAPLRLFTVSEYHRMAEAGILNTKLPLYARANIAEVWLVDLVKNVVDVCSSPGENGYENQQRFERGAVAASQVLPALAIPVDEVLLG